MDIEFEFCDDFKLLIPLYNEHIKYLQDNGLGEIHCSSLEWIANDHLLIAFKIDKKIIGFSAVCCWGSQQHLFISYTHILEDYRGRGAYGKYIEWLLDYCKTKDICAIHSIVHRDNNVMNLVKEKVGFREISTVYKIDVE